LNKIKRVLISQPQPADDKNPFLGLAKKKGLDIHFRQFIQVEGVSGKDFRKLKVDVGEHDAVIMTSKTAVNHFFRVCEESKITVSDSMKYFCANQAVANYLQKYIVYRKRKIFYGNNHISDLLDSFKKHGSDKYLLPCSDAHNDHIPGMLDREGIKYTKVILYRTISSDLSDLADVNYDLLVFFSPSGIKSLFDNFPEFVQNGTLIAAAGPGTSQAAIDAGLKLNIQPNVEAPSIITAIENYIENLN
jgi:uroporphyrinogen-III synthase